ncbi:MAG: translation initiation factor IF-2 subunit beta [Nitrososphaerota archaeon]|nr:translation initiation factor IF-2 subunit beta [Candidatus Bathyarchaeota archaeon]MDW8049185.1 translation initiation factor IF-2 subunit beta [Nitrososphaerota archaeon]
MALDYERMLDEAYAQLPTRASRSERLEVPKPRCTVSGSRTVLHNFGDICDALRRDQMHLLRFLSKEMATAGVIEGSRVIFQGRFEASTIERLIQRYMEAYVTCPVCKRPDTKLTKEKRLSFMVCDACGARSPVKAV